MRGADFIERITLVVKANEAWSELNLCNEEEKKEESSRDRFF